MPKLTKPARREKFSEADFMHDVERRGGQALKQDPELNAGIEDRLCWLPVYENNVHVGNVWFWAEWKRGDAEPPKHQLAYHTRHRQRGHIVYVFSDNAAANRAMDLMQFGDTYQSCV